MRKGGREKNFHLPRQRSIFKNSVTYCLACWVVVGVSLSIALPISKIDIIYQGKTSQTGTLCISEYPNKQFNSDIYLNKIKLSILNKY